MLCCVMQVRLLVAGVNTVLGDAAADAELFVTEDFEEVRQRQSCQNVFQEVLF